MKRYLLLTVEGTPMAVDQFIDVFDDAFEKASWTVPEGTIKFAHAALFTSEAELRKAVAK